MSKIKNGWLDQYGAEPFEQQQFETAGAGGVKKKIYGKKEITGSEIFNFKVLKEHSNINCRLNSFVCRNINVWNSLPAHVVESDSVAMFKRRLSRTNILCS